MNAESAAVGLLLALLIDHFWGEPAPRWHPVVWMGNYLSQAGARLQTLVASPSLSSHRSNWQAFALGAWYWLLGAVLCGAVALGLQQASIMLASQLVQSAGAALDSYWTIALTGVLQAPLLKPMLAWSMLKNQVQATENALAQSLPAARLQLVWLVSRDSSDLDAFEVRQSAIESLAENLSDSVLAPLFWFALLGLPGAVIYRFANTADAMWGYPGVYQGQNWAWAGKFAARADDILNWLPARLTAWLLALGAGIKLSVLRLEASKTPSPNSGWPMAAMALALHIRLSKRNAYVLNPAGALALPVHTGQAVQRAQNTLLLFVLALLLTLSAQSMLTP